MIVDINGVPHYFWRGKLYPGGTTPPHHPRDGAPRVIANRIDGGCDYLPDPDWVPPATAPASPPATARGVAGDSRTEPKGTIRSAYVFRWPYLS